MLKNYIKIAFRNVLKHKGYSAINISGLAIGIASCLLILIYVRHEISYDKFHEKADRIFRVHMLYQDHTIATTPSMVAPSIEQIAPEIEKWVRLYEPTRYSPAIINTGQNKFQEESFFYADSSFFEIFSFKFIAGNPSAALSNPRSLVLPRSTAEKLFGTTDILGKTINAKIFNTEYLFEITGVIEDVPANSSLQFDYLASLNTIQSWSQLTDTQIAAANFFTYVLLDHSGSGTDVSKTVNKYISDNFPKDRISGLEFFPLTDLYLKSDAEFGIKTGSLQNVIGFAILALMILVIAIINYVNLATARSSRRAAEVGVRKTLGAQKSQLIKQFYGESIILTFIAAGLALAMVEFFKDSFFKMIDLDIDFSLISDPLALLLLAGITVVTAALAGSYPAVLLSSYQPVKALKGILTKRGSNGGFRKGLVVFQFATSTLFIISTIIIYQQTDFVLNTSLGFDDEQIIILPARDNILAAKQDLLKDEVLRQPGVKSATYMSNIPGKVFGGYSSEHTPNSEQVSTAAGAADPDLVETLGITLLTGTGFPDNPGYSPEQGYVYLINEKLANAHGWTPEEAVGKRFNLLGNREGEVVGVMKDFNYQSLREEVAPLAFFINKNMYNYLLVKLSPDNISASLASLENVWQEIAPHRPFEFEFLDRQLNALYKAEMQTRNLLLVFSGLAIFIACLGLIGLSSFMIEQRSKEIGIRKIMGASILKIVRLLTSDFLKMVFIGFIIGIPVAWYLMKQWLNNYAYRIDIGISVFVMVGLIAMLVAVLTVSWQSVKAAVVNPVNTLRNE